MGCRWCRHPRAEFYLGVKILRSTRFHSPREPRKERKIAGTTRAESGKQSAKAKSESNTFLIDTQLPFSARHVSSLEQSAEFFLMIRSISSDRWKHQANRIAKREKQTASGYPTFTARVRWWWWAASNDRMNIVFARGFQVADITQNDSLALGRLFLRQTRNGIF